MKFLRPKSGGFNMMLSLWLVFTLLSSTALLLPIKAGATSGMIEPETPWNPEALIDEFPNLTSPEVVYLQVTGVDVSSEETYTSYLRAKEELETMGIEVSSHYELEREISDHASEVALASLKNATDFTREIYSTLVYANRSFGVILSKSIEIYPLFGPLNSTLPEMLKAYQEAYLSASQKEQQLLRVQRILNESSREYSPIHRNLTTAHDVVNNLTPSVADFKNHLQVLQKNYTVVFLRATWTYRWLRDWMHAYETGTAPSCKVGGLSAYLNIGEDFIYYVFYSTYPAYKESGYAGMTDELFANVTANYILESMNTSPYKTFDREFGETFISKVLAYDAEQGSKTAILSNTHNPIDVLSQIVNESLAEMPSVLSSSSSSYYFPHLGNVSGREMSLIVKEVKSQEDPWKAAVNIAIALNIGNVPKKYYSMLRTNTSLEGIETSILSDTLSTKLPDDLKPLSYNISEMIVKYERESGYPGVLSTNPEALRSAALEIIVMMSSEGDETEKAENSQMLSPEEAATAAASRVFEERLSDTAIDYPPAFSEIVTETITSYFAGNLSGKSQEEILGVIFTRTFGQYSGVLVKKFYSRASPREAAVQVFDEIIAPKLLSNSSPESSQILEKLLKKIPEEYPLTQRNLKEISLNATIQMLSSWKPEILGTEIQLPAQTMAELAWEFKGHSELITESDVSEISQKIYESAIKMHENHVLTLKGPDDSSFIVMVTQHDKTGNVTSKEVVEVFSAAFASTSPTAEITVIAPFEPAVSSPEKQADFTPLVLALTLLGALILLVSLRGAVLATLISTVTVFVSLKIVSGTIHEMLSPETILTVISLLLTSGLAFALSYHIIESFRKSLVLSTSEEGFAGKVLKESRYGMLLLTALSGAAAVLFGLSIVESIGTALLTAIPVFIVLNAVLLLSLRILGDKLVFWWPLSAEKVLQDEGSGETGILRRSLVVFLISLTLMGGIAQLMNYSGASELKVYGSSAYIVLSSRDQMGGDDLQTIEKVAEALAGLNGVAGVYTLTRPYGVPLDLSGEQLMDTWASSYLSRDGKAVLIVVKIGDKPPENIEKLIQDKLEEVAQSSTTVVGIEYEGGIAVLKTQ